MEALFSLLMHIAAGDPLNIMSDFWQFMQVVLIIIGALFAWWLATRKRNRVAKLLDKIERVHVEARTNSHATERELLGFKNVIAAELKRGKIDEPSYLILDKRIDDYIRSVREHIIEEKFSTLPSSLKNELKIMIDDGKVTEGEVYAFEKVLSSSSVSERDKGELRSFLLEWQARKGNIPSSSSGNEPLSHESHDREPQILSRIKKSLSLGPVVVGRRKKT